MALLALFLGLTAAPGTAMAAGPIVTTDPATSVTSRGATLNGTINPQGSSVFGYQFQYGPSSSAWCMNGGTTQPPRQSPFFTNFAHTDSSDHPVSWPIGTNGALDFNGSFPNPPLERSTTYCYRLASVKNGSLVTFTTGPPIPATLSVDVTGPGSVFVDVMLADGSFDRRLQCAGADTGPEGRHCTLDVLVDDVVYVGAKTDSNDSATRHDYFYTGACSGTSVGGSCKLLIPGDTTAGATFTASTPSDAAVDQALAAALTPSGPAASIAAILKAGSYPAEFKAPGAGTAQIAWYQGSKNGRIAAAKKSLLVAKGAKTFTKAGKAKIKIKLTAKGKALLRKVKKGQKLALTAKGSFTPKGGKKTSKQKSFTLKR